MEEVRQIADFKFRRDVERLCLKGPRVVGELLAEIGAERSITTILEAKLSRYTAIDDMALSMAGGDRFPPPPLHRVRS